MAKTILIADDSDSIRKLLEATLQSAGYDVLTSVDGEDALRHLTGQSIDLLITDLNMPGMDGIALVREVRKKESYESMPILLLTTESRAEKREEAKVAGATGWVVKPFVQSKLLAVIQKLIR